jgi:hypothetical protein
MTAEEITKYLTELNDELRLMDIKGEVSLYGGAVMCLAFKARPATKDVDAIFEPVKEIRNASHRIAERYNLKLDWLNFAVKMFVVEHKRQVLLNLSHLKIFVPEGDYMLAMKILSFRPDTSDIDDVKFLIDRLGISSADEAVSVVANYYPRKVVKPETIFRLEELFEE